MEWLQITIIYDGLSRSLKVLIEASFSVLNEVGDIILILYVIHHVITRKSQLLMPDGLH